MKFFTFKDNFFLFKITLKFNCYKKFTLKFKKFQFFDYIYLIKEQYNKMNVHMRVLNEQRDFE